MPEQTALYQKHVDCGGKMVEYGGFLMPVQYTAGLIAEHLAVRRAAGLFDVSHMGELLLRGKDALATLQMLLTNDMDGMAVGACRYSPMCNPGGGVVDDLITCRLGGEEYMLVVNAANRDKDARWIAGALIGDTAMEDISDRTADLALQGPLAQQLLAGLTAGGAAALPEKYYTFISGVSVAGVPCLISRTGYTGEDGFELYCDAAASPALWDALLCAGREKGLLPCGLGARDTLRLEAAMPLYGHEMNEEISPLQAGLAPFVKRAKPDFIGKAALESKEAGPRRTGLRVTGRGIAREGAPVYLGEKRVGAVTSGTQLPFVGWPGAMALMDAEARAEGTQVEIDVRGRRVAAEVVKLPFYKRNAN